MPCAAGVADGVAEADRHAEFAPDAGIEATAIEVGMDAALDIACPSPRF